MTNRNLIKATGTILVNKNIESTFDFFANPTNDSLWRTEINDSIPDGPLQPGTTISEYSYLSKKAANNLLKLQCVHFDRNHLAIFETPTGSRFYLKSQRMVKAVSDDTTEITYQLEFDKSIVKFAIGINLPDFIVSYKAKSDMKKYLRQLKQQLEEVRRGRYKD